MKVRTYVAQVAPEKVRHFFFVAACYLKRHVTNEMLVFVGFCTSTMSTRWSWYKNLAKIPTHVTAEKQTDIFRMKMKIFVDAK